MTAAERRAARLAEIEALGRQIHHLAREIAALRLRRRRLLEPISHWERARKTERGRAANKAACKRYRERKKAQRLANPYMGRKYEDARLAA